jgi:FtsP/CotA-like multicopper oxidase with cupredoxin domain
MLTRHGARSIRRRLLAWPIERRLKFRYATVMTFIRYISTVAASSGGKPGAGVIKDVVMLAGFQELECEFVANASLFHCHQQLHMDFGFMAMFNYA